MGMSAIEIYKLLPKTNCGDCGFPTCLAFAMQLANMKVELGQCEHVSQEAVDALGAAAAPPIKLVAVGEGDGKIELGDEKVLFRHEKTFYHQTALVGIVEDGWDEAKVRERAGAVKGMVFDRVGRQEGMDSVAVWHTGGDMAAAAKAAKEASGMPLVLASEDKAAMAAALGAVGGDRPLVVSLAQGSNADMVALAKEHGCPVAVTADGLEMLADEAKAAKDAGAEDIMLLMRGPLSQLYGDMVAVRRLAIEKGFRELGFPILNVVEGDDPVRTTLEAATLLMKYSSMLLLPNYTPETILPMVTLRLNIYTDPQKPIQVKPEVYEVGEPGPDSPFMLTSNFSLTYFSVEGDVDKSKVPSRILVVDTEGLSVLTAFAAGKMEPEKMAEALESSGIAEKLSHKNVIIPGMISRASGKLQDLSGWTVIVGPRESSGIPSFLRNL